VSAFKAIVKRVGVLRVLVALVQSLMRRYLLLARPRVVQAYFRSHPTRKLHVGAGFHLLQGWLNADILPWSFGYFSNEAMILDAKRPFPLEAGTVDYVYSEHLIEHLTYREGLDMLRECYRVLRPDGRIRIATPDLRQLLGLCAREEDGLRASYIRWSVDTYLPPPRIYKASFVINNFFRAWGHQFIYDRETLQAALESVGFTDVTGHCPGESDDENLHGIEHHGEIIGDEMNRFETMVLEARRPALARADRAEAGGYSRGAVAPRTPLVEVGNADGNRASLVRTDVRRPPSRRRRSGGGRGVSLPVPILLYHSVSRDAAPRYRRYVLSPEAFEAQMAYLHRCDYTPLTVTQFVRAMAGGPGQLPARPVVLTFDDGLADFYAGALPILQRFGFLATLYVTTGFVGSTARWLERTGEGARAMLTWPQLVEISGSGIECGAHGRNHVQLDTLAQAATYREIVDSKLVLEERLAREVETFAYPHGCYSPAVRQLVRRAGYSSACAVKQALSAIADDRFALARVMVTADADSERFAGLLAGRGLPVAPTRERLRTKGWRFARRSAVLLRASYGP
jgi:peptidoglycan/xylan/chitin deacetylase (PgdA/CDA1 family)/predicted SAM-dependent methyltransferase